MSQSPQTGELLWCSEDSPALICSSLSEVAANGTELCSLAGAPHSNSNTDVCIQPLKQFRCSSVYSVRQEGCDAGVEAVDVDDVGANFVFPGSSTHPGGVGMCLYTAKFRSQRPHGSLPHQEPGFAITTELLQEFLIWVVAFSTLLGILIVMITRQRKKARKMAWADSVFSGREGDSQFDSDIIREYKERYYAREKGLQAALGRARNAEDDGEY